MILYYHRHNNIIIVSSSCVLCRPRIFLDVFFHTSNRKPQDSVSRFDFDMDITCTFIICNILLLLLCIPYRIRDAAVARYTATGRGIG